MINQNILHLFLGEWSGTGRGEFPTIEPFEYLETLRFTADHRPFVHYEQKTQRPNSTQSDYIPSHWESGFIRLLPDGQVELINAQGSGRLERLIGSLEQTEKRLILQLGSATFMNDPRMLETKRTFILDGNTLHYTQDMGTTAVSEISHHVEATLKRVV